MAGFNSPLGNRKFNSSVREFDVPDESEFDAVGALNQPGMQKVDPNTFQQRTFTSTNQDLDRVEQEIKRAREDKRLGRERLNEGAKKRIDMLVGMTRHTRSFDIGGNTYILQTLKGKEIREALIAVARYDGTVQGPFESRCQLLARSLTHIADVEFDQFIGSSNLDDKLNFIEEMDNTLLNRLYSEYLKMVDEAQKNYGLTSAEAAKEVIEDIKK